jgi:3-hydroxyisobutyrate dehydrogenase-like beta-hydroxyacid dehydrogenase
VATVGIVSPGAMGSAIGRVLLEGGSRVVVTTAGRSERTRGLAEGLEVLPAFEDVVAASDIVLSVVPPGEARTVADAIASAATETGARPLVADLNAISPATAADVARRLGEAGLEAVDGSISGPPPRRAGTTVVYLSGPAAARVAGLPAPGLELRVVGITVGAASAVKMSTASFYKGQVGLLTQALRAAHRNGVLEHVLDDLGRAYPELAGDASRIVQSAAAKSGRYVAEMHQIAETQEAAGLTPDLFNAYATIYAALSASEAASKAPEDADRSAAIDEVLASLDP